MLFGNIDRKLLDAAALGDTARIDSCLKAGADIDAVWADGTTPLLLALRHKHARAALLLVERGANIHYGTRRHGETAMHWVCGENMPQVLAAMIARGGNVDICDHYGNTPLIFAAFHGDSEAARVLLENGAASFLRSPKFGSAADMANRKGFFRIAELIAAHESGIDRIWQKSGEDTARRVSFLENGVTLTEYLNFADKMHTSILRDRDGSVSHASQSFNKVAREVLTEGMRALRRPGPAPAAFPPRPRRK